MRFLFHSLVGFCDLIGNHVFFLCQCYPPLGGSSQDLDTWLITMVIVSPLNGVIPLINGLFMACK